MGHAVQLVAGSLVGSISRNAGGLYESVRCLNLALAEIPSVTVMVFSLRDAHSEEDLAAWQPLAVAISDVWGPPSFGYAPGLYRSLLEIESEILHVHGIWQYPSLAATLWSWRTQKPLVISAHGMLDPWAVRHSRWKKRLATLLYEGAHLRRANCLRALCMAEAEAMRAFGLRNPICVIPNGIHLPENKNTGVPWGVSLPPGTRILFYLGRLHPKKNLSRLIDAWAAAAGRGQGDDWCLVIAGWDQGGYEATLKAQAQRLGLGTQIIFTGPLFGQAKVDALHSADAFVLPSLSEGLPMVVLEAWAYGLPVLMTDACNLPEGFEWGAAMRLPLDQDGMATTLAAFIGQEARDLSDMGARGRRLVEQRFTWKQIAADMYDVYQWVLGGGPPPNTVITD